MIDTSLLQALMENIPDSVYFKDLNNRFIRVNRAAASWYGIDDPSEVIGKTDFDLFTKEHAQPAFDNEQEVIRSGIPVLHIVTGAGSGIGAAVAVALAENGCQVIAVGRRASHYQRERGIFDYLQKMNGMYFIPIFAVVLIGMVTKRIPPIAAKIGLMTGFAVIAIGYFVPPFNTIVASLHEFHFLGIVFSWLLILMLVIGEVKPRETEFEQEDVRAVDMTPWKHAKTVGVLLIIVVFAIYITFANFSVLAS